MYSEVSFMRCTFHDGNRYHIETSPLIGRGNQRTGLNMIETSVIKAVKIEADSIDSAR